MGKVLNDLNYANYQLSPNIRPLQAIQALYEKKDKDYTTALDTLNNNKTVLNEMPYNPVDEGNVLKAKQYYSNAYDKFREKDDLENQVLNTKELVSDTVNKFGLSQIQKNALTRSEFNKRQQERYEKGEISKEGMNRSIRYNDRNYKGVQFNEETGTYIGSYATRDVLNNYNFAEETAKAMEGFKAGTITLTNEQGQKLIPDGNNGYLNYETGEGVTKEEVERASISYLQNSPEFKDYLEDEMFYEIDNITYDSETKENRKFEINDLANIASTPEFNSLIESLGIKSLEELKDKVENKEIDAKKLYKATRAAQVTKNATGLAVEKESFTKVDNIFKQNWLLKDQIDAARKVSETEEIQPEQFGLLNSWNNTTEFTKEDSERVATLYNNSDVELKEATKKLATLEETARTNPKEVNPDDIDREKTRIKNATLRKQIVENNIAKIYQFDSSDYFKATGINATEDVMYNFYKNQASKNGEEVLSKEDYLEKEMFSNFRANKGTLDRLVIKAVIQPLNTEDLKPYIRQDDKYNNIANSIGKQLNNKDAQAILENHPEFNNNRRVDYNALSQYVETTIAENGENGINKLKQEGLTEETIAKAQTQWNNNVDIWATNKAKTLNNLADNLKERKEKEGFIYNRNMNTITLPPNMTTKEKASHPVAILKGYTQSIIDNDFNYYTKLRSSVSGTPVLNDIVKEAQKLDDFDDIDIDKTSNILWNEAKLDFSTDVVRDAKSLRYSPTLKLEVPIKSNDGKSKENITLAVSHTEPSYAAKYKEMLTKQKDNLVRKSKSGNLLKDEEEMLKTLNTSLYNLTEYGDRFDLLDINSMGNNEKQEITFWDGFTTNIKSFEYDSPSDKSFYLVDYIKNKQGSYVRDAKGDRVEGYWAINNNTKEEGIVTEDKLKGYEWTAIGANKADDLKSVLAGFVMEAGEAKKYNIELENTVDIADIFQTDVKGTSLTRVDKSVMPAINYLKQAFPNLVATDGLRDSEVDYGAEFSEHKEGKGLDFRKNQESLRLLDLDRETLAKQGIKKAEMHGDHIHVEFI